MNTNLTKRLVLYSTSEQTRERKGRQGVRKGEIFHRVLCAFLV